MESKPSSLSRRRFLQLTAAAPALLTAPSAEAQHEQPEPGKPEWRASERRPNVLVIMPDQHRWNYITAAGHSPVPTPNIDRIAARGIRFPNAICPYPVCCASRMALLSGLYSHSTGVIDNLDVLPWNTPTVAHHFANRGYHTGLIGKAHFNDSHTHGFQYFLGANDWFMYLGPEVQGFADAIASADNPYFFEKVNDVGSCLPELPFVWGDKRPWAGRVKRIGLASELSPDNQFEAFVARESCRFLERYGSEPFFLCANFLKPHAPIHPPQSWADKYRPEDQAPPPVGDITGYPKRIQRRIHNFQATPPATIREERAGYRGCLDYVDTCIGEIYDTLERLDLVKDTIVIYTSDHGEMDGDHGLYGKFCLFEGSVRVPLIVSQPGRFEENKVSDALVEYIGLYPTLAELTGAPPPHDIDARSFADVVRNPEAPGAEAIFSEFDLRSQLDSYMVRTRRYKYIYNHNDIPELYDLEADPDENRNRGADPTLARIRKQLHDRLVAWYDFERNPYRGTAQKQLT